MSYLFHKDVFMPNSVSAPCFEGRLRYSHHAIQASKTDRFGGITLPEIFVAANAVLIESEYKDGHVIKQVWRQTMDEDRDLVLVLNASGNVKTVWINLKTDKHGTLRRGMYVRP